MLASVMILHRDAYGASAEVAVGDWSRERLIGRETAGKLLGLVGFGSIARETARRAAALAVAAHDPFVAPDDPAWALARPLGLNELLMQADAVSLHVPLTEATRHLIGPDQIALMKPGAVLVNAARGGVLDEAALVHGL